MPYRVVKKINGRDYLYEQETYREGGKVRTKSKYIGAVVAADISKPVINTTNRDGKAHTDKESAPAPPKPLPEPSPKLSSKPVERLRIKARVEPHKISRAALEAEHRRFTGHMESLGLKMDNIRRIRVGSGKSVRCRKTGRGDYVITLPRHKVGKTKGRTGGSIRTVFRREYRKALAGTYLDAIKAQDPQYYAGLEQNLSAAFKIQNKAISKYLMNSKRKPSQSMALTLHFMHSKMLSDWSKARIPAQMLGLADHARRSHWRQDAEATMAEIQRYGWTHAYSKYMDELSKAQSITLNTLTKCQNMSNLDIISGKRRAARKELRKLNGRRKALNAACNKISILAPLFQSYKDKGFDGRNPFAHETLWRDKLRRREQMIAREALKQARSSGMRPPPRAKSSADPGARDGMGLPPARRGAAQLSAVKGRAI